MSENRHTIRNIDHDLMVEAKVHVLQTGRRTLGELVSDAIELLIYHETREGDQDPSEGLPSSA